MDSHQSVSHATNERTTHSAKQPSNHSLPHSLNQLITHSRNAPHQDELLASPSAAGPTGACLLSPTSSCDIHVSTYCVRDSLFHVSIRMVLTPIPPLLSYDGFITLALRTSHQTALTHSVSPSHCGLVEHARTHPHPHAHTLTHTGLPSPFATKAEAGAIEEEEGASRFAALAKDGKAADGGKKVSHLSHFSQLGSQSSQVKSAVGLSVG